MSSKLKSYFSKSQENLSTDSEQQFAILMGFSPGPTILFYKCLATQEARKVKLLTSEWKPPDVETLQNKFFSFLFFQLFFFFFKRITALSNSWSQEQV